MALFTWLDVLGRTYAKTFTISKWEDMGQQVVFGRDLLHTTLPYIQFFYSTLNRHNTIHLLEDLLRLGPCFAHHMFRREQLQGWVAKLKTNPDYPESSFMRGFYGLKVRL
jgi:hypothetical protein